MIKQEKKTKKKNRRKSREEHMKWKTGEIEKEEEKEE